MFALSLCSTEKNKNPGTQSLWIRTESNGRMLRTRGDGDKDRDEDNVTIHNVTSICSSRRTFRRFRTMKTLEKLKSKNRHRSSFLGSWSSLIHICCNNNYCACIENPSKVTKGKKITEKLDTCLRGIVVTASQKGQQ